MILFFYGLPSCPNLLEGCLHCSLLNLSSVGQDELKATSIAVFLCMFLPMSWRGGHEESSVPTWPKGELTWNLILSCLLAEIDVSHFSHLVMLTSLPCGLSEQWRAFSRVCSLRAAAFKWGVSILCRFLTVTHAMQKELSAALQPVYHWDVAWRRLLTRKLLFYSSYFIQNQFVFSSPSSAPCNWHQWQLPEEPISFSCYSNSIVDSESKSSWQIIRLVENNVIFKMPFYTLICHFIIFLINSQCLFFRLLFLQLREEIWGYVKLANLFLTSDPHSDPSGAVTKVSSLTLCHLK